MEGMPEQLSHGRGEQIETDRVTRDVQYGKRASQNLSGKVVNELRSKLRFERWQVGIPKRQVDRPNRRIPAGSHLERKPFTNHVRRRSFRSAMLSNRVPCGDAPPGVGCSRN